MQTITFYAYKGGTGRTLALANAAKYLARLGQNVFIIDLDLEAPGLHHKLRLNDHSPLPVSLGMVDCLYAFAKEGLIPESLAPFTLTIPGEETGDGKITLLPAGDVTCGSYWKKLAELNWHELFFRAGAEGILFILELKERIRTEFKPDFLLIDARTGITELGGVATTLLPDLVVCLLLNNRENLEGAREVIRSVLRASAERKKPIKIVPVLARLPGMRRGGVDRESQVAESVRAFLCEKPKETGSAVDLPPVFVLHSEESLAFKESLRIGGEQTVEDSPLLRDYLRLFAQVIPNERVEPHLDRLIGAALQDMIDKPDRVQGDLESLAIYCPHPSSYLALLKFYRLRSAPSGKILQTAVRFWELSRQADHPILWEVVKKHFNPERRPHALETGPALSEFVEAVWKAAGQKDPDVGLRLVNQYSVNRQPERAKDVIQQILVIPEVPPDVVVACINRLIDFQDYDSAQDLVVQWVSALTDNPDFQTAWATLIVGQRDSASARSLFESQAFRPASILAKNPLIYIRLLSLAGRKDEMEAAMQSSLDQALASEELDRILNAAYLFDASGKLDSFKSRVKEALPKSKAEHILEMVTRRRRGAPFPYLAPEEIPF